MKYMQTTFVIIGLALLMPRFAAADSGLPDRAQSYREAQASFELANAQYQQAMRELVRQRQAAMKLMESSPAYLRAAAAVESARDAYEDLRSRIKQQLTTSNKDYVAAARQVEAIDAELERARHTPGTTVERFNALYQTKAQYTSAKKRMEDDALEKLGGNILKRQWADASRNMEIVQAQAAAAENAEAVVRAREQVAAASLRAEQASIRAAGAGAGYSAALDQQSRENYYRDQVMYYMRQHGSYRWWYGGYPYYYYYGYRLYRW